MKAIVVAVDFSEASLNAAHYGASLANIFGAKLVLVHTYLNPQAIDRMDAKLMTETGKGLQEVLDDFMEQNIDILRRKFNVMISGIVKEGAAVKTIHEIVNRMDADLLVMGMKGKGETSSVFGSTTARIMPGTTVPVLVVPSQSKFVSPDIITLASDFDEETASGNYDLLKLLASHFSASIQIVNVLKKGRDISIPQREIKVNTARIFEGVDHQFFSIEDNEVDEGIEEFLDDHPSHLLVMLARKQNFLRRFFGTVHTRKMIYETKIPLLVLQDR